MTDRSERFTVSYTATLLYEGDIGTVGRAEGAALTRQAALDDAERDVPAGTRVVGAVVAEVEPKNSRR